MTAGPRDRVTTCVKSRALWQPKALQMLREGPCSRYARRVTPPEVDGFRIEFPETHCRLGLHVTVCTRRMPGETLFDLLQRDAAQESALDAGVAVLRTLRAARVTPDAFGLFRAGALLARKLRIAADAASTGIPLAPGRRTALLRMARRYSRRSAEQPALVHGDLHAAHILVDGSTLGVIDLEAMHVGKPATDFVSLWMAYRYAAPALGQEFHRRYAAKCPGTVTAAFYEDARVELALEAYHHVRTGARAGNPTLVEQAGRLLDAVLSGASFEEVCTL